MSDETNPNVNVTSEPVAVAAGTNIGFDQVASAMGEKFEEPKKEQSTLNRSEKSEKAIEKGENKPVEKEELQAKSKDEAKEVSKEEKEPTLNPEELGKTLKGKIGDKEFDIYTNAQVEVTIDGKKEAVSVQDLINQYSGKQAWDKKFTELDKERKTFKVDKETVETNVQEFFRLSESSPTEAIAFLAEITGKDPLTTLRTIRDKWVGDLQKLAQMTPEQREVMQVKEEAEMLRKLRQSDIERRQAQQTKMELETKVEQFRETNGVTSEQMREAFKAVKEVLTDREPTLDDLAEYFKISNSYSQVNNVLDKVNPELKNDSQVVDWLVNSVLESQEFNEQDLVDIVEQAFGKTKSKAILENKAKKAEKATGKAPSVSTNPTINPSSDPISFDDI